MRILAIESSCDDTAAAVLEDNHTVLSNVISSQFEVHAPYGGIVPELASRRHIEMIWPVVHQALAEARTDLTDIGLIAATRGPGLVGSLLIGFTFAKALALVRKIPCVGVDHMAGHLLSVFLDSSRQPEFPYLALIVSGGNTSLYRVDSPAYFTRLGRTRDDAAGEAFDKVAKLLDLGYPGGPVISRLALQGNRRAISFPRAWLGQDSLDFSFSGVKTAVVNHVHQQQQRQNELVIADICASFQEALVEVLVGKTLLAAHQQNLNRVVLGGGVSANNRLREHMTERCSETGLDLFTPEPVFCTDNAAMIGLAGYHAYLRNELIGPDTDAYPRSILH